MTFYTSSMLCEPISPRPRFPCPLPHSSEDHCECQGQPSLQCLAWFFESSIKTSGTQALKKTLKKAWWLTSKTMYYQFFC